MSQSDVSKARLPISGRSRLGPSFDKLERLPGANTPRKRRSALSWRASAARSQ
jgi:hypothetical protein